METTIQPVPAREAITPPAVQWGMFFLALLMVPIVLIQVSTDDPDVLVAVEVANALIWSAFLAELVYARRQATAWRSFFGRHWLDVVIVVLSPPLVPAQLASLRILRLMRLVRLVALLGRLHQGAGHVTGRQGIAYVAALVVFLVFIGGVSLHEIEPDRAPTVWDGFWWAIVTLTTIGYGDIAPGTFEGRALAAALMFAGLGMVATLAGSVGALFLTQRDDTEERLERIERRLDDLARSVGREGPLP